MMHSRRRGTTYRVEIYREDHREASTDAALQGAKELAFELGAERGRRLFSGSADGPGEQPAGVSSKVPWTELGLNANECGELFGVTGDYFLRTYACRPGFPARLTRKPATWKAGEVIEWRNTNRAG